LTFNIILVLLVLFLWFRLSAYRSEAHFLLLLSLSVCPPLCHTRRVMPTQFKISK